MLSRPATGDVRDYHRRYTGAILLFVDEFYNERRSSKFPGGGHVATFVRGMGFLDWQVFAAAFRSGPFEFSEELFEGVEVWAVRGQVAQLGA